ncbi:UDP-N-acetylglucosamine 1-carboxyvinyltransferase [Candidatus Cyrtobacter comes]|uniref:UDP-N-acetylglucosamine 1-carboxyvinyltransferase n=1 Tax=Candidatus Cyrtobacter comes TaxID=675776 RepID=A0ABU5L8V1_9RICK|nr:UDP-N-acetylglucosamine 1-carboxyvinyltransferase [Candidatus Cyrtobacter comes]MDZ5762557.1 UDP-N-acetylglucosamine 1-carboxyvinyltransferase [Candidatus Cyrtobacter comes]
MRESIDYVIQGGSPVRGQIRCMGAKNFATKAIVASCLGNSPTFLYNVPDIGDVDITKRLIAATGVTVSNGDEFSLEIDPLTIKHHITSFPDSRRNRLPILLLGVLLHKFGKAEIPFVGGDKIGRRNVDFHIKAAEEFGATIQQKEDRFIAHSDKLKGSKIKLPYPSVGATETSLFLSVLAEGKSVIENIAIEPEVIALITMLRSMGAIIFLDSNRCATIHGVKELSGTRTKIIGDRIEAASWASLACASDGEIEVIGVTPDLLGNFLSYYTQVGGGYDLSAKADYIKFYKKSDIKPTIIETDVYPGFSTDWQQPFATLLTQAHGTSVIHETVYESRFKYLEALNKLNARTQLTSYCLGSLSCRYEGANHMHSALINGPTTLKASKEPITIPDIRAGLSYLIAAAIAHGETVLEDAEHIERGYGNLIDKLKDTNLNIKRFKR